MEHNKFLRYCTNCNHYNKSFGICSYISSNIHDDPDEFTIFCNGNYLSLIEGKRIKPFREKEKPEFDTKEELVTIYTSNCNNLFHFAKSILDYNKLKYVSIGNFLNSLEGYVYSSQVKVFIQDSEVSRKLLSEIKQTVYEPSIITDKKLNHLPAVMEWHLYYF